MAIPMLRESIFAFYQREALLRDLRSLRDDLRSLREGSRSLCERERSVVRPMFAESGSKNRLSPIARSINPIDSNTFTGLYPLKTALNQPKLGRSWT